MITTALAPDRPTRAGDVTRERILDVAERLFADHGIGETSLRAITSAAGVNLASVHYHFGSKEELLRALFERRVRPMNEERRRLLADCRAVPGRPPLLEQILAAFLKPAFDQSGGSAFIRLRGRMAIESSDLARRLAAESFDETSGLFLRALATVLPELGELDLFWRFHFLLGAQVYTMANPGRIQSLSGGTCDPGDSQEVLRHLVPFVAAGLRAPGTDRAPA